MQLTASSIDKSFPTEDTRLVVGAKPESFYIFLNHEPFIAVPKIKASCSQITICIVLIVAGISLTTYFLYRFSIFP